MWFNIKSLEMKHHVCSVLTDGTEWSKECTFHFCLQLGSAPRLLPSNAAVWFADIGSFNSSGCLWGRLQVVGEQ